MYEAKNTQRALVRIGYDGRVYKTFRGDRAKERFENECMILRHLESSGCNFVPRLIAADPEKLELVTGNCGARVEQMSEGRIEEMFASLQKFGVRHDDPFLRNITYRASDGQFCVIDFEFATLVDPSLATTGSTTATPEGSTVRRMRWSGATHPGRFRPNNEDSFLGMLLDRSGIRYLGKIGEASTDQQEFLFAVSDGMGGEKSGEFASKIAIDKITLILPKYFGLSLERFIAHHQQIVVELFESIHQEMLKLSRYDPACRNMGATLTLGWFKKDHLFFGHIGDSRLYHLPAQGAMIQCTDDHSHVGWLRRNGKINEREARMHPRKNVLAQALGAGHRYLIPQVGMRQVHPGDQFLLCTDGVVDGLWDRAMEELTRTPSAVTADLPPADRLVHEAVAESGRDNATAVVVEAI
jgi:serine/threonine protein phosphatase PrpC